MKKFNPVFGILTCLILTLQSGMAQEKSETITGTVVAVDWDDEDNPIEIAIATDEEDILIAQNDLGVELFELIDNVVNATGTITLNDDNEKVITISSYEDLGPATDEEDDDDEPGT